MRTIKQILLATSGKRILITAFLAVSLLVNISSAQQDGNIKILYKKGILSVQNECFERQYRYDYSSQIHSFYPIAWIDKIRGLELQGGENQVWFETCINGKLITNQNGGWDYDGFDERKLENGGTEILVRLKGQKQASSIHEDIALHYRFQIFPKSTIMRERFEIVSTKDKEVHLNKYENQIRLIFPRYLFKVVDTERLKIQETRLALWEGEVLPEIDWSLRPNDRLQLSAGKSGRNLSQNHMYHPAQLISHLPDDKSVHKIKGPISIMMDGENETGFILAYEHGSPDNDTTQNYLAIELEAKDSQLLQAQVRALKGAYVENEIIDSTHPYATAWVDVGYFHGNTFDQGQTAFWKFLYHNQSEHLAPRKPTLYYNTWGLQRDDQMETKIAPQEILTEQRVLEEIDYAHQLGVDVFVIDDGWQSYFGDWQPVTTRFPDGFKKIKSKLDNLGMRMGLWFAAEGIDPNSKLYREHPEWLVRNEDGSETIGRWDKPIGCFSSGYKNFFTELCKYWIDQGVTYFKWDGLDKHLCYSPHHFHGDESNSPEERAYRSGYDFILVITDVAKKITEYNPNVVIVFDVTEQLRQVGLAFLSEARFFWINNGATWYDDLSYYRTKSIRSVAYLYNQIIPTVLQTSATYPHQSEMYGAQAYNVNTTLLGGRGFWGDLSEMTSVERERVGEVVYIFKKIAQTIVSARPRVTGTIGSSPEIYEFLDPQKSEGAIFAFSGSALQFLYRTSPIDPGNFLCVLRNAYSLQDDGTINLPLHFPQPDATCAAFILSNHKLQARIESSTCWLKEAEIEEENSLIFINGAPGMQQIFWSEYLGKPIVQSNNPDQVRIQVKLVDRDYLITVEELYPEIKIEIRSEKK
ncbi:MAG TPA: alpha-galactosidase [bacterium]